MASISPTRPTRRAAARKKIVVDESDDEGTVVGTAQAQAEDDEMDFTPAPQRSPRRPTRRRAVLHRSSSLP